MHGRGLWSRLAHTPTHTHTHSHKNTGGGGGGGRGGGGRRKGLSARPLTALRIRDDPPGTAGVRQEVGQQLVAPVVDDLGPPARLLVGAGEKDGRGTALLLVVAGPPDDSCCNEKERERGRGGGGVRITGAEIERE